jgi:hypothetical protein
VPIAHAKIERFENPETDAYDRYSPRLNKHASALIQEWCDEVLFATYKVHTRQTEEAFDKTRTHGIGTGDATSTTCRRPCSTPPARRSLPRQESDHAAHRREARAGGGWENRGPHSEAVDADVTTIPGRGQGFTATPFRLDAGPICRADHFLHAVCFEVGVRELIRDGYLSKLVSKGGDRQG